MNKTAAVAALVIASSLVVACAADSTDEQSPASLAPRQPKSPTKKVTADTQEPTPDAGTTPATDASPPTSDAGADEIDPANLPGTPTWTAVFKPPMPAHQNKCSAEQIGNWVYCGRTDWLGPECQELASTACTDCVRSAPGDTEWGPIVFASSESWINTEGCVASIAGSTACASKIYAANACLTRCNKAKDYDACVAYARTHICQTPISNAESCAKASGIVGNASYTPCGDPLSANSTDDVVKSVIGYFCGQ